MEMNKNAACVGLFQGKLLRWFLVLALALSFFGLVDDRYRGWDDTNQYQLEARSLSQGRGLPLPEITENSLRIPEINPVRYPIGVTSVWSGLVDPTQDWRQSLVRIRLLQCTLLAISIFGTFLVLGSGWGALLITILFYCHAFFRESIVAPVSEIQSLFLLVLGFLLPLGSGVWFVCQLAVRPVVSVLHLARLWDQRKSFRAITLGVLALLLMVFAYGNLLRSPPANLEFGPPWIVLYGFADSTAKLFFTHLLSSESQKSILFQVIWSLILGVGAWFAFQGIRARFPLGIATAIYLAIVLSVYVQGSRYFLPLILVLLLELKPQFRGRKWLLIPCALLSLHLVFQQFESIRLLRRDREPPTDHSGLQQAQAWVGSLEKKPRLMMHKFRYCLNYFAVPCSEYPRSLEPSILLSEWRTKKVDWVVFSKTD